MELINIWRKDIFSPLVKRRSHALWEIEHTAHEQFFLVESWV
jgi:hypothetical protein